jgi:hypothetical protein
MDLLALLETLLTCGIVPLFVLGVLAFCGVVLFILNKKR